jgi:hypothetical protein
MGALMLLLLLLCHLQYPRYGDIYGAWAPQGRQGRMEHIELSFERPCRVSRIFIFETFNPGVGQFFLNSDDFCIWFEYAWLIPGAVVKIATRDPKTQEWVSVWEGSMTQRYLPACARIFDPKLSAPTFATNAIRIDMNTNDSASWRFVETFNSQSVC